jgi:hypothetical protein
MQAKMIKMILLLLSISILTVSVNAGWWIFGKKTPEGVQFRTLTVNNIPFEEADAAIILYRDSLQNGLVKIAGQATSSNGKIGTVQVSINGKSSWVKAKLAKNGVFEYTFTPVVGTKYDVYVKAIDTTNSSNDIEATKKIISVENRDLRKEVQAAIDEMVAAYCGEQNAKFMGFVSEDFTADKTVLDRAVRSDFTLFDNIDLRCNINSLATGKGGNLYVALNYTRFVIATKDGKSYKDKGLTEFVFQNVAGKWKIYSMKMPLIFGISNPNDVATGTVTGGENGGILVVTPGGGVQIVDINDADDTINGNNNIEAQTITLNCTDFVNPPAYIFDTDMKTTAANGPAFPNPADMGLAGAYWVLKPGSQVQALGQPIQNLTEAPTTGYGANTHIKAPVNGISYAVKLPDGKYVLAEIVSFSYVGINIDATTSSTITIKFKYQPNGTNKF